MDRWQQAIEAACEAVRSYFHQTVANQMAVCLPGAIEAIRAISIPDSPDEDSLVGLLDAEIRAWRFGATPSRAIARAALSVVREHDANENERLRAYMHVDAERVMRERDAARREAYEVKLALTSIPKWHGYRLDDWRECAKSIALKLSENAGLIVSLMREADELRGVLREAGALLARFTPQPHELDRVDELIASSLARAAKVKP